MAVNASLTSKSTARMLGASGPWSGIYGLGMVLIFTGERIVGTGTSRAGASAIGLACLVLAMVARVVRGARTSPDRRSVELQFLSMYVLGLVSVALYFVQSDVPALRGGKALDATSPKLATALAALWPVLWAAAVFAVLPMELAYAPMSRAPRVETGRVRAAQFSGMGLAFMLTFAFSLSYAASERDKKVDLAYFRTTRPGESTRKIVRGLDQPITVALFYPNGNEVREETDSYFTDLARESGQLKVEHYDYDLDPAKARELGVSANGAVVFVRGGHKEQLPVPVQLENARTALKTLDREVQQRLLSVVKPKRITYFTEGHGERTANPVGGDTDHRPGVRDLRAALVDQGHEVRDLGPAEGLATDVPKEATLVMVIGPTKPFAPEELASLQRFLDRGGRLFLALDPDGGVDLHELLGPMGVKLTMATLANDQVFARRTHQDSDRINLVSGLFSSHPSVSTLSREGAHAPVVLPGATAIEGPPPGAPRDYTIDFTVHAHFATFADSNGNFQFDAGEIRKAWELGAAISKKKDAVEQRTFVIGDSDFLTDPVIRFAGNGLLVLDPVRWLIGEESFAGMVTSEADVPINHTRKQDVAWFYSTIFVVPGAVLGLGFMVTRRRRRAARRPAPPADATTMGVRS